MADSVVLTREAEEDILRNSSWWAEHHSLKQALEWEASVRDQLLRLALNPQSHSPSAENGIYPTEIRDGLVGARKRRTYRAVFTIKNNVVVVLRVFRSSEQRLRPTDLPSI